MKIFLQYTLLLCITLLPFACASVQKKEEPFEPEKWIERAEKHIERGEFQEARNLLLEVKNRDRTMNYAPKAQLKMAESYIKEEEIELAIEEYRKFLREFPEHPHAPYAQYQIASLYFQDVKGPERGAGAAKKALEEFERLKILYPRNPYRDIVDIRIEKCREVIAAYELMVGKFYFKKDSFRAARGRLEGLIRNYPDFRDMPEVLYLLWKTYRALEEKDKAESTYHYLLQKYPDSKEAIKAKKEYAKLEKVGSKQ
ncbi:MAG: outer membrane protein assembly factor BamD [Thermodesulfovibrionales bacterium]|nr:outer membrane protein assembly factor BamD [Thermodesulfovibrionales bacterium]